MQFRYRFRICTRDAGTAKTAYSKNSIIFTFFEYAEKMRDPAKIAHAKSPIKILFEKRIADFQ